MSRIIFLEYKIIIKQANINGVKILIFDLKSVHNNIYVILDKHVQIHFLKNLLKTNNCSCDNIIFHNNFLTIVKPAHAGLRQVTSNIFYEIKR